MAIIMGGHRPLIMGGLSASMAMGDTATPTMAITGIMTTIMITTGIMTIMTNGSITVMDRVTAGSRTVAIGRMAMARSTAIPGPMRRHKRAPGEASSVE